MALGIIYWPRRGGQEFGVKGVLYSVTIGSLVGSAPKRRNIITSCP